MIEAPQTGDVVNIEQRVSGNSYWAPKFIGGLRPDLLTVRRVTPHGVQ